MAFITHPPIDVVPYKEIETFGPAAPPILRRLLNDPQYNAFHPQILTLLGNLGDASDTPRLNDYILNRYDGEISDKELRGVFAALTALGCLSDRDAAALASLRGYANPNSFKEIHFRTKGRDDDYLRVLLSQLAINGIGLSGRPEAGAILSELKNNPYHESQMGNVKDAIASHEAIMRVGRAHFGDELRRQAREKKGDK